jgi:hypothetical protein
MVLIHIIADLTLDELAHGTLGLGPARPRLVPPGHLEIERAHRGLACLSLEPERIDLGELYSTPPEQFAGGREFAMRVARLDRLMVLSFMSRLRK